jgi:ricin-type beta-trefoil lectin protein
LILAAGLVSYQLVSVFAPITHEQHNWRQGDVYSVAHSFHEDGFDFFHPRIDFWRGPTGIVGMEAPIYPAFAHLAMYVLGEHPRAARFVTFTAFWAAVLLAALILRPEDIDPEAKRSRAVALAAVIATSPMALCEFRTIQADGMSVSLTVIAAALFARYGRAARLRDLWLGTAVYSAAVVTKTPALMAGPALFLLTWVERPVRFRAIVLRGLVFTVPLAAGFAWVRWAAHLTETYEVLNPYFNLGFTADEVISNLTTRGNWDRAGAFLISTYAINWVLAPAAYSGLVLALEKSERRFAVAMAAWLACTTFFCICFGDRTNVHPYYATIMLPPCAYFAALGLANAVSPKEGRVPRTAALFTLFAVAIAPLLGPSWGLEAEVPAADGTGFERTWFHPAGGLAMLGALIAAAAIERILSRRRIGLAPLAPAIALVALPLGLVRGVHDEIDAFHFRTKRAEWFTFDERMKKLRAAIEANTTRADLVVTDGFNPWFLHLTRRRGFSAGAETDIEDLACKTEQGIRYYVHYPENALLPRAIERSKPIVQAPEFSLYRLEPSLEGHCTFTPQDLPKRPDVGKDLDLAKEPRAAVIVDEYSNKCIAAAAAEKAPVKQYACTATVSQRFDLEPAEQGIAVYRTDASGKRFCVAVPDAKTQQVPLRMEACTGAPTQAFIFKKARRHTVFVQSRSSGLVWDMPPSLNDGESLQQFDFNGGSAQQWRVEAARMPIETMPRPNR